MVYVGNHRVPLGQHFLICKNIAEEMVYLSNPKPKEVVVEIGPGKGIITERLLESYSKVIVIEKDNKLCDYLNNRFSHYVPENLVILNKDIRDAQDYELKNKKVVSSIPYYLSSSIIFKLIKADIKESVLLLQKEFAHKLVAERGRDYVFLSYLTQIYYIPIYIKDVSPSCFSPTPKVESSILKLTKRKKPLISKEEHQILYIAKHLFNYKNKNIIKALKIVLSNLKAPLNFVGFNNINNKKVKDLDVYGLTEVLRSLNIKGLTNTKA